MTRSREAYAMFSNKFMFMDLCKILFKPAAEGYLLPLGDPQRGGGNNDLENLFQCLHPPRMQDTWDILLLVIGVNIEVGFYMKSFLLGISATSVGLTEQLI